MRNNLGDIVTMPLPTQVGPRRPVAFTGTLVIPPPAMGSAFPGGPTGNPNIPGSPVLPAALQQGPETLNHGGNAGVNPFTPQPLIPDDYLPPVLRRTNPILRRTNWTPTPGDMCLWREAIAWKWIQKHGGIPECCFTEHKSPTYLAFSTEMPTNGEEFKKPFSQPLTSFQDTGVFTGDDVILGQFQVPYGYDGVINRFICGFTGDGFVDFSGSIIWRLIIGIRYAKDLGNVQVSYGSLQNALLVPGYNIPLVSGQTVSLIANIPVSSGVSGGNVFAACFGSFNPRR